MSFFILDKILKEHSRNSVSYLIIFLLQLQKFHLTYYFMQHGIQ